MILYSKFFNTDPKATPLRLTPIAYDPREREVYVIDPTPTDSETVLGLVLGVEYVAANKNRFNADGTARQNLHVYLQEKLPMPNKNADYNLVPSAKQWAKLFEAPVDENLNET